MNQLERLLNLVALLLESRRPLTFEEIRNQGSPSNMDLIKTMTEIGSVQGETNRNKPPPCSAAHQRGGSRRAWQ